MVQTHSKMWYSEATEGDWQIDGYISMTLENEVYMSNALQVKWTR